MTSTAADGSATAIHAARLALAVFAVVAVVVAACGDPPPDELPSVAPVAPTEPQVTCLGVVASKCADLLQEAVSNGGPVAAIRIACTKPPCTERQGDVKIDVLYANGQQSSTGNAWATVGGGAAPPEPAISAPPANP